VTEGLSPDATDEVEAHDVDDAPVARDRSARYALGAFLAIEAVALVVFMDLARHNWFATDEWEFLAGRTGGNLHDLFSPHFDHWVTLPLLYYRALWLVFGLRTYRPYQLSIVVLHLVAALLVWVVMRRIGVRPWTATAAASILVFLGADFLNIVSPFQITIVGSLVFGLVQMLLVTHDEGIGRRDALGLVAGAAALMCSGVGVAMVIAVGCAVLMCRGWRPALLQTVPLGVMYLVWYAAIGHVRPPGSVGYDTKLGDVLEFTQRLFRQTFDAMGHITGVGIVLGIVLVVGLALAWAPLRGAAFRRAAAIPIGLFVGAIAFVGVTAVGRSGIGDVPEFGNRYLSIITVLLLPAVGLAADTIMRRWRITIPLVVAALLVGIPGNVNAYANFADNTAIVKQQAQFRQLMLSLPRVPVARQVPRNVVPYPDGFTFLVTIGWLLDGAASGRIPRPAHITAAEQTLDTLRLSFTQTSAGPVRGKHGDVCSVLHAPLRLHLETGQHVVIGSRTGEAQIEPIGVSTKGAMPFLAVTAAGPTFTAVRPITFRVRSLASDTEIVCAAASSFERGLPTFPA
jgi:hypothetical protein